MKIYFILILISIFSISSNGYLFTSSPLKTPSSPLTDVKSSCGAVENNFNRSIFSGYLNVNKTHSNSSLFYIFYAAKNQTYTSAPIIIWLNGGPGASSLLGAFYENGPFYLNDAGNGKYEEKERNINWGLNYNLLYVDQPIGTGLSYLQDKSELTTNQSQIADHFYNALQEFYNLDCFKDLKNNSLIISGESYAGKFVPSIAKKILESNDENINKTDIIQINLTGISIGDGFTDPMTIMAEVGMFSYNLGLIDYQERMKIETAALKGFFYAKKEDWVNVQNVFNNDVFNNLGIFSDYVNVYDIQRYGDYNNSGLSYFNDTNIQKKYHIIPNTIYQMESDSVYGALASDFMKKDCVEKVEYLLGRIPVLIYNGQDDLIVTNAGTMTWVENLKYAKNNGFNMDFKPWLSHNDSTKIMGYKKSAGNLELRIVLNAGHMVPQDQPQAAFEMISDFVERKKNALKI